MNRILSVLLVFLILPISMNIAAGPTRQVARPAFADRPDVHEFIQEMVGQYQFDEAVLRRQFNTVKPSQSVLKAIRPAKSPRAKSWLTYRQRVVEPVRIQAGMNFWRQHEADLARAEATFGVPAEIIVAIIGVETIYGRDSGNFNVFNSLATLAFEYPPRADLFRRELQALLLLAREEGRDPLSYRGSFAGALGLPQFLPSSVRRYAVDFDQDGRIDLENNATDAIGSVGHFLQEHGWQTGTVIALPARVDGDVIPLLAEGIRPVRMPDELAAFGVHPATQDTVPAQPAALIDLPTPDTDTEFRLGFNNFYMITRYNRSNFYAASVMDLAEAITAALHR